jgi:hypothetical protein
MGAIVIQETATGFRSTIGTVARSASGAVGTLRFGQIADLASATLAVDETAVGDVGTSASTSIASLTRSTVGNALFGGGVAALAVAAVGIGSTAVRNSLADIEGLGGTRRSNGMQGIAITARTAVRVLSTTSGRKQVALLVVATIARKTVVITGTRARLGYALVADAFGAGGSALAVTYALFLDARLARTAVGGGETAAWDLSKDGFTSIAASTSVALIMRALLARRAEVESARGITSRRGNQSVKVKTLTSIEVTVGAGRRPVVSAEVVYETTNALALTGLGDGSDDTSLTVGTFDGSGIVDDGIETVVDEPCQFNTSSDLSATNVGRRVEAIIGKVTVVGTIEGTHELIVRNIGVGVQQLFVLGVALVETSDGLETTTTGTGVVVFVRVSTSTFSQEVTTRVYEGTDRRVVARGRFIPQVMRLGEEGVATGGVQGRDSTSGIGNDEVSVFDETSSSQDVDLSAGVTAKIGNENLGLYEDLMTNVGSGIGQSLVNDDTVTAALPLADDAQSLGLVSLQDDEGTAKVIEVALAASRGVDLLGGGGEILSILLLTSTNSPVQGDFVIQQLNGQTVGLDVEVVVDELLVVHRNDQRARNDVFDVGGRTGQIRRNTGACSRNIDAHGDEENQKAISEASHFGFCV